MTTLHSIFEDGQPDLQIIKKLADNEALNGAGVDMLGYRGAAFIALAASGEAATFELKVQQDSASGFGTAADLAGTALEFTTGSAANGFGFVEVKDPTERYLRPVLTVPNLDTANAVAVISVRYGKDRLPESNSDGEIHHHPAEGTA